MKKIIVITMAALLIWGCATVPKEGTKLPTTSARRHIPAETKYGMRTVVIDPGHGGKDPGAITQGRVWEKHIVLRIAKLLKGYLEDKGINVVLTRDSDRFITLFKRTSIANRANADFFISIHANIARAKHANGIEIFYLSEAVDDFARMPDRGEDVAAILWDMLCTENRAESIELAQYISKTASKALGIKNRGVKAAKFYVLKGTHMPAVLVEVGFLSNKDEVAKLKDHGYQNKLAKAIADGIILYKQYYEHNDGFTR